jgi:cell division topological specificity factor
MKEIFTDLYKKVLGFFQSSSDNEEQENAKDVARNRLKLVLMQDRTNLTPYLLERMRGEMIEVLSKYVEMDKDELELNFEQEGEGMALMLSIPVVRAKDEEEIQAILDAEDNKKSENNDEVNTTSEENENSDDSEITEDSENTEKKEITDYEKKEEDEEIVSENANDDENLNEVCDEKPVKKQTSKNKKINN